jgi:hypothetical protein
MAPICRFSRSRESSERRLAPESGRETAAAGPECPRRGEKGRITPGCGGYRHLGDDERRRSRKAVQNECNPTDETLHLGFGRLAHCWATAFPFRSMLAQRIYTRRRS